MDYFTYLMAEVDKREKAKAQPLDPAVGAQAVRNMMAKIDRDAARASREIDIQVQLMENSRKPAPRPQSFGEWA